MIIEKLQYITQETDTHSHIDCVREACIAGVRWIQLRVKDKSQEEYLTIAKEARIICNLYDAKLIINDNVEVAKLSGANGVHLGKKDTHPVAAREELGGESIIGGTANTLEDITTLMDYVDYIGLGPYKFTTSKENLSPVLGVEGYQKIIEQLKLICSLNDLPIIAVGGIEYSNIQDLLDTGVYGVAFSGLITRDFTISEKLIAILNKGTTVEKLTIN